MLVLQSDATSSGAHEKVMPGSKRRLLTGKFILVVEDEFMIAMDYAMSLEAIGATVLGPVSSVPQAFAMLHEHAVDAVLLDIDLQGTKAFMVADTLVERHVGFVFASGYDDLVIPERFAGVERLHKPINAEDVAAAILRVCG